MSGFDIMPDPNYFVFNFNFNFPPRIIYAHDLRVEELYKVC